MNRINFSKPVVAAAIALGALCAGTAAHARTDVSLVVGVNAPSVVVQPQPAVMQYRPAMQPQPVYVAQDRGRFERRGGPFGDADRDGVPNRYDRDSRFHDPRAMRHAQWSDRDRDGVPDRFDRAPFNPRRY